MNVFELFSLAGRVALITGGNSGIGRTIANALSDAGARVVLLARREAELREAADAIVQRGGQAAIVASDLSDRNAIDGCASAAERAFGAPDIVVNCAGINIRKPMLDLTSDDWDRTLRLNLDAPFFLSQRLVPAMIARGWGRIINIASQLGQIGGIEAVHYSASKAGVIGLTKALAREVSHRGVLVNAIAPGPIQTPLLDGETEEWRSAKLAELPMRRFGTVAEVTPTAVLLASSDGDYYAGQTLGPNGGDVML